MPRTMPYVESLVAVSYGDVRHGTCLATGGNPVPGTQETEREAERDILGGRRVCNEQVGDRLGVTKRKGTSS
ncbi:hypothetical protein R1flu_014888 [Riccia fluitans]|uniref:Uncharacterized protein n=1 Tax=Riccia fluitans TaxID=41844 RepID=A0ABD1YL59_9MARC